MKTKVKYKTPLKKDQQNKKNLKIKDERKPKQVWNTLSEIEKLNIICLLF
ncbi:hypothetical protein NRK67_13910 [Fusobacteria bacterium ZRK30]|nr:hypothetical protein NRK67_13910 [Fusobacteria bacterium ZRK30]